MKISVEWLQQYIDFQLPVAELADRLTMVGLEVEEILMASSGFSGVFVGEILEVEEHPNADRLKLCTVSFGEETVPIVCGAPNVAKGQRVPVARVGAVLKGDHRIDKVTLRGVESMGMICSERELGLSDNHDGILVLEQGGPSVGEAFVSPVKASEAVLEINVTPNRPDCLSHIGVAREVGAILGRPLQKPDDTFPESEEDAADCISLLIEDPDACPRYTARVVRDITTGPSPNWLKKRLESVGIRSINNVVDVTNYVLMETGHPLHAFDYDLIQGKKIIVRKAEEGERFVTLDGNERKLLGDDLLICDGQRPVALAGVMGGLNSEVVDHTRHILLESAYFDPMTIRRTAKRLGLSTEASQRFERGVDPNNTVYAVNRAARLLQELNGGSVCRGIVDAYPDTISGWEVPLRPARVAHVLGERVPESSIRDILDGLGLSTSGENPIRVHVPTFRPDLKREIDLIEEIVRLYGFDKIAPRLQNTITLQESRDAAQSFIESIKDTLVGMGFFETLTNTLVPETHTNAVKDTHPPMHLQNPISPDTALLRNSLIPSMLDTIRWNVHRSTGNLRFFEIGKTFWKREDRTLPEERWGICVGMTGMPYANSHWPEKNVRLDFHHLRGVVEALARKYHVLNLSFQHAENVFFRETAQSVSSGGTVLGVMGVLQAEYKSRWDLAEDVFLFEIDLDRFTEVVPPAIHYAPISKFPMVKRDMAIVVDDDVPAGVLRECIEASGKPLLFSVGLFDLYRGNQLPEGKKSLAFSLEFSSSSRTLKEEEIEPIMKTIIETVEHKFSARLRS